MLDLAVNSASERGLLGIALHPKFRKNGWIYLFWTESTHAAPTPDARRRRRCWATGVDRFEWDGSTLDVRPQHCIQLRALPGRRRPAAARQPRRRRRSASGPTASSTSIVGDTGRRGQTQNLPDGPFGARASPGRPVRRAGARRRAPHRRDPAPQRRRHDAARQPVLRRRRRARRRGRRQPAEALRLRPPQRLRHGVRPGLGRPVGAGERRRLLQRAQPRRAGHERRLGAGHGPARPRRRSSRRSRPTRPRRSRSPRRLLRPAADPLAADEHRRHAGRGARAAVRAARARATATPSSAGSSRSPRAASASSTATSSAASTTATCSSAARADVLEGGHLFRLRPRRATAGASTSTTRACRTASPTTSTSARSPRARACCSAANFGVGTDIQTGPDGNLYVVSTDHGTVYEIYRPRHR